MKKWIYVTILLLSVILVCLLNGYDKKQKREQDYWVGRYKEESNKLNTEPREIKESSEALGEVIIEESTEPELETETPSEPEEEVVVAEHVELVPLEVNQPGTIQFLFVGLNKELYDEILPIMNEYGYKGIIGISDEQYLFPDGNISRAQFYEMIDNGWKTCLVCEDSSDFDTWYKSFKNVIASNSIKDHNMVGEIVDLLQTFKQQPTTLMMPKMPNGSFAKKLYSLYLTYLPVDKFKYTMKMNVDDRGSFTELVHTVDCGQVSINISKPGITKGQHWHNSKWELFIVVAGHGLIQERNINTGEIAEFEVSGDNIEAVHMIPGWTHNIINLSTTENLVTVMTCNEIFDTNHPDTFFEPV